VASQGSPLTFTSQLKIKNMKKTTTIYLVSIVISFLYFGYLSATKNIFDDVFIVFTDVFFTMITIAWFGAAIYMISETETE
jgi:hypothetical protein